MNQNITQQIQVVQRSEIGLKRSVNQDSIGVGVPQAGQSSAHALFIVADGVGGNLPKGEVASRTAVESMLAHYYAESDETDMLLRVGDALQDTNISVRQRAASEGVDNIGTTIVGFSLAPDGEAIGFNVGDSRLYRIRGGDIERISEDQVSLPEPGVLKDEFKPRRVTKIAAYIGQPNLLEPNFYRLKTQIGDTFLLCSDGVWSKIPDEELLDIVDQQPLEQASERLVKLVYERNAPDNLSVVLVRLGPQRGRLAAAEPIGEMPTAIMTPAERGERGGSRLIPILIGIVVVVAAAIGGIGLLQQQANTTPTAPAITQLLMMTATAEQTVESIVPSATAESATDTPPANATAIVASVATIEATKTPTPRATATVTASDVPPSSTPTLKPSASPTLDATKTPTTEPTVIALIVPTNTPTKAPSPTATETDVPTLTPTVAATDTPTLRPTNTVAPTTTVNPTLITYTPSPTFTITPSLTRTQTPTPTATATYTATPTATATSTATYTATATLTQTASPTLTATNTLTATATFTPTATLSEQQAAATGTAFAQITPSPVPTLYAPQQADVVTLSQAVTFYPSADSAHFTVPTSGGIELPPDTVVSVVSNLAQPIDGLIYSYVVVQGTTEQKGWVALAPAAQAFIVAHLQAGVIIRKGPGQGYERVGLGLKDGERAVILGQVTYKKLLWYYVDPENAQSQAGWVYAGVKDLEVQGNLANVPIRNTFPIEPTPLPTPTLSAIETETPTVSP